MQLRAYPAPKYSYPQVYYSFVQNRGPGRKSTFFFAHAKKNVLKFIEIIKFRISIFFLETGAVSNSLTAGMLDAAKNSPELVKSTGSPSKSPQAYLEKGRTHGDRTAQLCGFDCLLEYITVCTEKLQLCSLWTRIS